MAKQNLSDLNVEELNKKEQTLKKGMGVFIGLLSLLAIAILTLFIRKQYNLVIPFVAVLVSLLSILAFSKKNLAEIKTEIALRKSRNVETTIAGNIQS